MKHKLAYLQPRQLDSGDDNVILLDVRGAEDYAREHISESINIPLEQLPSRLSILPVDKKLVLVCRDGHIARKAAYQAMEMGRDVYVLDGGLLTFQSKNYHVKKNSSQAEKEFKFVLVCGALTSIAMLSTGLAFIPLAVGGAASILGGIAIDAISGQKRHQNKRK